MSRNKQSKKTRHPVPAFPARHAQQENKKDFWGLVKGREAYVAFFLIAIVAFFVFKDFLLFNKVFQYKDIGSDTMNGLYPPIRHTADYIHRFGIPSWSFNYGMGQNIFPFFLHDPFDLILYIIGKNSIPWGFGYLEFLKVVSGGIIFFFYLRTIGMKGLTCITGALLFSFSGFMILGGGWFLFSYEAVNTALLLLAFERLYRYNSWFLFPFAVAGIVISQPFNLYLYGLFLAVYAAVRFLEDAKAFDWKKFLGMYGKLILFGLFGLALSSVFLFENVLQLIESPRGSGGNSYFEKLSSAPLFATGSLEHNITAIFRLFASDLLGTGSNFKGWNNYLEAPIFYSGLLSILLFPQVFPFLSKKNKIVYAAFFFIWVLPVVFPYFRYAFWLFTGDYYRGFSFFVSLTFIFLTVRALNHIDTTMKINFPILIVTVIVLFSVLSYPYYKNLRLSPVDPTVMGFVKIMLFVYALLVIGLSHTKIKPYAVLFLLVALCAELGYLSGLTVNRRSIVTANELSKKIGYNDYTVEAVAFLKKRDNSFYRVDKNYFSSTAMHGSLNDGLAQDYYGTSAYHSFNQKYYILFLQSVNVVNKENENESRWANGLKNRPALESLGSVKYFLTVDENSSMRYVLSMGFDSIGHFGDVTVSQNKNHLPLGFAFDKYLTHSDFDKLSNPQKDFTLLRAFFIEDGEEKKYAGLARFQLTDTLPESAYTWDLIRDLTDSLRKNTLHMTEHGQTHFKGTIDLEKKELVFFSIPFDKGWKAHVDGKEQEILLVDAGLSGILLEKGKHNIELDFIPRFRKEGTIVSLTSLGLFVFLAWRKRKQKTIEA